MCVRRNPLHEPGKTWRFWRVLIKRQWHFMNFPLCSGPTPTIAPLSPVPSCLLHAVFIICLFAENHSPQLTGGGQGGLQDTMTPRLGEQNSKWIDIVYVFEGVPMCVCVSLLCRRCRVLHKGVSPCAFWYRISFIISCKVNGCQPYLDLWLVWPRSSNLLVSGFLSLLSACSASPR